MAAPRKYSEELKERATRLALDARRDPASRVGAIKRIADQESIPLSECAYIGDDVNDIAVFDKVGLSIAFNSNKLKVNQAAKVVIESRNLKSILPHLCVREKEPLSLSR